MIKNAFNLDKAKNRGDAFLTQQLQRWYNEDKKTAN